MTFHGRGKAAEYLTERSGVRFMSEGLAARATKGTGPSFSIVNGKAIYAIEDLDGWLAAHFSRRGPSAKRVRLDGRSYGAREPAPPEASTAA